MATDHTHRSGEDAPEALLPEDSVLSLEESLAMHAAVGNRPRYEMLSGLVHSGEMSPKELEAAITIDDSTLY